MYAVIRTGGKQYRVEKGDRLSVEKLDAEAGAKIELDEVLMVVDGEKVKVGTPLVEGAKVTAEVAGHGRGNKIRVIKFKRRKNYLKQAGHRQGFTELEITGIKAGRASKASAKKTSAKKTPAKKTPAKKTPAKKTPAKETTDETQD